MKRRVLAVLAVALVLGACTTTTTTVSDQIDQPDIPDDLFHDAGGAARALAAIEKAVGASPAQVRNISVYGEYMIVEAQDPNTPDHLDSYTWRDGDVGFPEPVHLSGPQEDVDASLYPTTAVNLKRLPDFVRAAEDELEHATPIRIEEARVSYLSIARDTNLDGRVVISLSIGGPRRSGYVEMSASGEILSTRVD